MMEPQEWESFGFHDRRDNLCWMFLTALLVAAAAFVVPSTLLVASRYITRVKMAIGVYTLVLTMVMNSGILPYSRWGGAAWMLLPLVCAVVSYSFLLPDRAQFAAANLKVASFAITSTPKIMCWALFVTMIRCMWIAVGVVAYVGSLAAFKAVAPNGSTNANTGCRGPWAVNALTCACNGNILPGCTDSTMYTTVFLTVFWMVSVWWSLAVGANVAAATVADSVASRWSSPENVDTAWQSCYRVIRSSLGSLCKVAAMDSLSLPLRFVAGRLSHGFWVVDCLVLCLRVTVSYVLLHPLFFIGVYRFSFAEAVRHAREVFRVHGRTLLINDAMVLTGVSFLYLAASTIPAVVTFIWGVRHIFSIPQSLSVIEKVFVGTMLAILATLEVLMYAVKAVFVCLLRVPEESAENDDRWPHNDLYKAWRELQLLHPTTSKAHGGVQL